MDEAHQTILDALAEVVGALALEDSPEVRQRMLPSVREEIDALPCVLVCPSEQGETPKPLSMEADAKWEVPYACDVVIVAANNQDFLTHQQKYLRWREQVRQAIQPQTLAGAADVFRTEVRAWAPLDRGRLNQNYAYSGLTVVARTKEAG